MAEARKTASKTTRKTTGKTTGKATGKTTRKTSSGTAEKAAPKKTATRKAPAKKTAATTQSSSNGSRSRRSSPLQVAAAASEQLAALTGKPSEGVVGIERHDGEWIVEIEVLELRRVPSTTDVLARYRVTADERGDVTGYQRVHRYSRGTPGEE